MRQSRDEEFLTINIVSDISKDAVDVGTRTQAFASSALSDGDTSLLTAEKGDAIPGLGLLVLCSVPLVWGTYVPIVRLLYEIDPPIPGFLFSAFYFFISAVTTIGLSKVLDGRRGDEMVNVETTSDQSKTALLAGLELGSWLFMGNTLQLLGLKTVASDRAGFLVQCKLGFCFATRTSWFSNWCTH